MQKLEVFQSLWGMQLRNPNRRERSDEEAFAMVAEAGFEMAVSTRIGAVLDESDRYQLPRFTPWDRRMSLFGLRLLHVARSEASAQGHAERG